MKNDINKLYNISKLILNMYKKLIDLEKNNLKNSKDYILLLSNLKLILKREEEIYKELGNNIIVIAEILLKYFKNELFTTNSIIQNIRENKEEKMIFSKIIIKLNEEINKINCSEMLFEEDDIEEIEKIKKAENWFNYMEKLENTAEQDILKTIIKILNEYINSNHYDNIKDKLIKFKYLLSYSFHFLEKDLIEHNFEIESNLYWNANLIIDIYQGNIKELETVYKSFAESLMEREGNNLIDLIFEENLDEDDYVNGIISEIIIRACLLFIDNKSKEIFKEYLLKEVKRTEIENVIVESMIYNSFNYFENDKELAQILSFKKKK